MLEALSYPTVVRTTRLTGGGYVVAWLVHNPSEPISPYQVCFRRLDSSGLGLPSRACIAGSEVAAVNKQIYTIPRPDGGFVLAWLNAADGGVRSQAFDASGIALTEIWTGAQQPVEPGAAALAGGGYVSVSMQPGGQNTSASMISFQRYSSDGTPLGSATSVGDSGGFYSAQVVALRSGGFAVAWMQGGNSTVMTRVFSADGSPVSAPSVASSVPPACSDGFCHWQTLFGLAPMDDGGFVVQWVDGHGMALTDGTFARRFQPDGTPGAAIGKLDDAAAGGSLAPNGTDGFLLAWPQDPAGNGRTFNVAVRRFDATPLR